MKKRWEEGSVTGERDEKRRDETCEKVRRELSRGKASVHVMVTRDKRMTRDGACIR